MTDDRLEFFRALAESSIDNEDSGYARMKINPRDVLDLIKMIEDARQTIENLQKLPSARALRTHLSPEAVKRMAGTRTNAAFERYFWLDQDDLREMYSLSEPAKELPKDFDEPKKAKVLKFKK